MSATPTVDQIQRVIDATAAGLEPDEAIESVFGAPPPAPKKPTVMLTEFPDGVVIGWDFCTANAGGCGKHVSTCTCKGGPREPKVFTEWRTGEKAMPSYGTPTIGTTPGAALRKAKAPETKTTTPVVAAGQVPCKLGEHLVPLAEAEKNDDGTYTCFACQEAS